MNCMKRIFKALPAISSSPVKKRKREGREKERERVCVCVLVGRARRLERCSKTCTSNPWFRKESVTTIHASQSLTKSCKVDTFSVSMCIFTACSPFSICSCWWDAAVSSKCFIALSFTCFSASSRVPWTDSSAGVGEIKKIKQSWTVQEAYQPFQNYCSFLFGHGSDFFGRESWSLHKENWKPNLSVFRWFSRRMIHLAIGTFYTKWASGDVVKTRGHIPLSLWKRRGKKLRSQSFQH